MEGKARKYRIEAEERDIYSSSMLLELEKQLKKNDAIEDISVEKQSTEGEKGLLAVALEFAESPIGQTVISALTVEAVKAAIKAVYAHFAAPKEYTWNLRIGDGEHSGRISVCRKSGAVVVETYETVETDNDLAIEQPERTDDKEQRC